VTLIGSNCPASWVGPCVDCEGGRTAQIFSDCAITKYLSCATARQPCGRQTIAAVESLHSCYCLASSTHSSPAELPWTSRNTGRLAGRTTVASPHGQYPGTCSGDSVDRQNDGAPVVCGCAVACLLAVLTYGEALSDRIVSYRIAIFCVISYRVVSYRVPYGCIMPSLTMMKFNDVIDCEITSIVLQRICQFSADLVSQLVVQPLGCSCDWWHCVDVRLINACIGIILCPPTLSL